jgi:polyisoprenoid-binding protein YceI
MTEAALENVVADRAPGHWTLDPTASSVRFSHKTLWGIATVKGVFNSVTGEGEISSDGRLSGSIQVATGSLDTKNSKRDKHLRSADFFDVDTHPTIDFTVVSATPESAELRVQGRLTVKGLGEPLQVTAHTAEADADSVVLVTEAFIDRAQFGMAWNRLGMLRGKATVSVKAVFHRD